MSLSKKEKTARKSIISIFFNGSLENRNGKQASIRTLDAQFWFRGETKFLIFLIERERKHNEKLCKRESREKQRETHTWNRFRRVFFSDDENYNAISENDCQSQIIERKKTSNLLVSFQNELEETQRKSGVRVLPKGEERTTIYTVTPWNEGIHTRIYTFFLFIFSPFI